VTASSAVARAAVARAIVARVAAVAVVSARAAVSESPRAPWSS